MLEQLRARHEVVVLAPHPREGRGLVQGQPRGARHPVLAVPEALHVVVLDHLSAPQYRLEARHIGAVHLVV
eukprot:3605098-Alexandrium_andersonii.AAC.1